MRKPSARSLISPSGLTPEKSEESVKKVSTPSNSSSDEGENLDGYKNKAYWALPENVRNAIDLSKKKSKHSDFYYKMSSLNDKISVYKKIFYSSAPKFEVQYNLKKRERLEQLMRNEQKELEEYLEKQRKHQSPDKKGAAHHRHMKNSG